MKVRLGLGEPVWVLRLGWLLAVAAVLPWARGAALGTAFTYQGRLDDAGQPATGMYDLRFALYDAETAGHVIGQPLTNTAVAVAEGLFLTVVDFGPGAFDGQARWLSIGVRTNGSTADFTLLAPRQPVQPAPYALHAVTGSWAAVADSVSWSGVTGVPEPFADGTDNDTTYAAGSGLVLSNFHFALVPGGVQTDHLADGAVTAEKLASNSVTLAAIPNGLITPAKLATASYSSTFWQAGGNAGTIPGTHFMGTTDNKALELQVNRDRALRLEPNATAPSVVAGASNNVATNVAGAFIGGGRAQRVGVGADYAVIVGGASNTVSAPLGLAGGYRAAAGHSGSFVWADAHGAEFASTQTNQFRVRALGGFEFVTALNPTNADVAARVRLSATGGVAVAASGDAVPALDLQRGLLRVAGAGTRHEAPAFLHRLTSSNRFTSCTILNHPLCNGDPNAMLMVTPNENPGGTAGVDRLKHTTAFSVFYTGTNKAFGTAVHNRWAIGFISSEQPMDGACYNILVIKP
ncbi:MAG TPA: hypothetical protein PKM73_09665 [Verrucomicrobiota bacterium]|nr:hypothetical protein [Verrucomicrobiota bacterium]HNU51787.1 hypothetical protein [Verrucomicrobiota bacterium]